MLPQPIVMSRRPTVIYRAIDPYEARMLRDLLSDYGIAATVTGEALLGASGDMAHSAGVIRVLVARRDVELAAKIADAFQRGWSPPSTRTTWPVT